MSGGTLTLTQGQGRDIDIETFTHSTNGSTIVVEGIDETGTAKDSTTLTDGSGSNSVDSASVTGFVTFKSNKAFSASSSVADTAGSIFEAGANTSLTSTETNLTSVSISTAAGAVAALDVLDGAIGAVRERQPSVRRGVGLSQWCLT